MKTKIVALGAAKELWGAYKISLKMNILERIQREIENLLQIVKHTVGEEEFLTHTLNYDQTQTLDNLLISQCFTSYSTGVGIISFLIQKYKGTYSYITKHNHNR